MKTIRQRHAELWAIRHAAAEQWSGLPGGIAMKFFQRHRDAARYLGGYDELKSIANYAFTKARNIFDPSMGYSFSTVATVCIWREMAKELGRLKSKPPLARIDKMNRDGETFVSHEILADDYDTAEDRDEREAVRRAMFRLPHKLRLVLHRRVWEGLSLREVAAGMGVSKQRVQQLQSQAMERLHHLMRGHRRAAWEDQGELWEVREEVCS